MFILANLWKLILEIAILWFVFYRLLLFFRGSGAAQLLKGVVVLIIAFFIIQKLGLDTLNWLLTKLFAISVIAILLIFQPELRRGLTRLGGSPIFGFFLKEERIVNEIVDAVAALSKKKIGAIIAIEREVGLKEYIESGVTLDSRVTSELIKTIFMPNTPLHDGGIIIQENRIVAAGSLFPLTQNPRISKSLGTRHRAAVGLTEETDSIVIVVSEETGTVSISTAGKLTRELDKESLTKMLNNLLYKKPVKKQRLTLRLK